MGFALGVVPVGLLLLGFPIFLVLLTSVSVALIFFLHVPLVILHQNLFGSVDAYALLAIPFFIFAGELMGRGSVANQRAPFGVRCTASPSPSRRTSISWASPRRTAFRRSRKSSRPTMRRWCAT